MAETRLGASETTAIRAAASLSFLAVPMAMRDLNFSSASLPPTAARCLLIISALLGAALSSPARTPAEVASRMTNANEIVNRFIAVTFVMKFAISAVPQRLSCPSGGRQTDRSGRRPEVERKGEPRRLPFAVSRARKLEDDLTSKLNVAAPIKG